MKHRSHRHMMESYLCNINLHRIYANIEEIRGERKRQMGCVWLRYLVQQCGFIALHRAAVRKAKISRSFGIRWHQKRRRGYKTLLEFLFTNTLPPETPSTHKDALYPAIIGCRYTFQNSNQLRSKQTFRILTEIAIANLSAVNWVNTSQNI